MSFPNVIHGTEQESLNVYTTQKVPVGTKMVIEDGRTYRYVKNGAVLAVVGSLYQSAVPSADQADEAIDTLAAGVKALTGVGSTTGAVVADEFINGYIHMSTAFPLLRIKDNPTIAIAGTGTIDVHTPTPLAIVAATTASYFKNPWYGVIIHPSPPTALEVGVAVSPIPADGFGWVQTRGPAAVLTSGTLVIGQEVIAGATVDGSVSPRNFTLAEGAPNTLDGTQDQPTIGYCIYVQATTEWSPIFLTME